MSEVVSLHGHVIFLDKLYSTQSVRKSFLIIDKNKLSSICSDEANVKRSRNKGLLEILNKNGVNCPAFHCVIHQHALLSKKK